MKKFHSLFSFTLLLIAVLFTQESLAQDYTRWGLPEGTRIRLGKGTISSGDRAVAYSPAGTRIAVASGIGIWFYDADAGAEVALLTGHTGWVWSVAFSSDGQTLASGSEDNTVRLWDVNTGQEKYTLTGHGGEVYSVAFSSDEKTLASGSFDNTVRLWDVNTGQVKHILTGHTDWVYSVAFSPDGQTLASGSLGGAILLWDMVPYSAPNPDFDGDGTVGFPDFLLFVAQFGSSQGEVGYNARFDLDGDGTIGFGDFLILASAFDQEGR